LFHVSEPPFNQFSVHLLIILDLGSLSIRYGLRHKLPNRV
jgi:hypothetical protein